MAAVCTSSGMANTGEYYDRAKWYASHSSSPASVVSQESLLFETVTFLIAALGGATSVILSNSLCDDGSKTSKPGVPSVCFAISLFTSLLVTSNPPLHCVLPSLPFLLSFLVPSYNSSKTPSVLTRLSVLAPHALLLFILSYLVAPRFSYGVDTVEHAVIALAAVIAMVPSYTETTGLVIIGLSLAFSVPKALDFGSENTNPVRAPVTVCVVIATAASLLALVLNRRHKNGPLVVVSSPTTVRSFSIACLSSLRIVLALSAIRLSDAAPSTARDPTLVMFQMFTGASACLLLSSFAAAVADCWYPVGSCQYQMLAWDTLGLLFYFALPITILILKAWAMYDVTGLLISAGFVGGDPYSIVNGLATAVVCIVAVGVPIVNRWSILFSNWFAKCYTHGQPNTGKAAITVDYADLVEPGKGFDDAHISLWASLKKHEARLTIFVTLEDLKRDPVIIAELSQAHCIGMSTTAGVSERWNPVRARVQATAVEYLKVVGRNPLWYRGMDGHRHPAALLAASRLGMRIAFWSTYCEATAVDEAVGNLKADFQETRGGNIAIMRKGKGKELEGHIVPELVTVVNECGSSGIKLDVLDVVVREDHPFVLN